MLHDQSVEIWQDLAHFGGEKDNQFADSIFNYIFFH